MMKTNLLTAALSVAIVASMSSCDIDQTKEASLPSIDVDVDTDAGQMPAFDVDWADVNVGTRTETVQIPKVVVVMEEEEIEVPYVDVDMPDAGEKEELTLTAEAEVSGTMHKIDIVQVYATGKKLYVVSTLKSTGEEIDKDETVRISDRLIVNAPDLDVKHYIIGKRQKGQYNKQFSYVSSMSDLKDKMVNGKVIYKK